MKNDKNEAKRHEGGESKAMERKEMRRKGKHKPNPFRRAAKH